MAGFGGQTLLVLPGVSAASDPKYVGIYGVLRDKALTAGFADVEMCAWPGQAPCPADEEITLEGAVDRTRAAIARLRAKRRRFSLLGRSFGTMVAAFIAARDAPVDGLERIILWGTPPLYIYWKWFCRDLTSTAAMVRERGVRITQRFYQSTIPVELLLEEVSCPVRIATGSADPQVPVPFRAHLADLAAGRPNISLREAAGCAHEVTPDQSDEVLGGYACALFGE